MNNSTLQCPAYSLNTVNITANNQRNIASPPSLYLLPFLVGDLYYNIYRLDKRKATRLIFAGVFVCVNFPLDKAEGII